MNNQYKTIKYKIGDIITKIDPRESPIFIDTMIIIERRDNHCVLKSTINGDEMWFAREGLLLDESKLKINAVPEFHYYPNEKNKTKNR